jgi:hypothetical protein
VGDLSSNPQSGYASGGKVWTRACRPAQMQFHAAMSDILHVIKFIMAWNNNLGDFNIHLPRYEQVFECYPASTYPLLSSINIETSYKNEPSELTNSFQRNVLKMFAELFRIFSYIFNYLKVWCAFNISFSNALDIPFASYKIM